MVEKSAAGVKGAARLHRFWCEDPRGLSQWADHPHPWTSLYRHLRRFMPEEEAKRTAAQWFFDVKHYWPGSQRGANPVGPG